MVVYFSLLVFSCLLQATIALGPADDIFGGLEILDDVSDFFRSRRPPQNPAPYPAAHAANTQTFHPGPGVHPYPQHPNPYPQHPNPYPQHPNPYPQHPSPSPQHPNPYPQHPNPYPQHPNPYPQHPNPYPQHPSSYPQPPYAHPQYANPNPYPQHWPAAHPEPQQPQQWNQPYAANPAYYPPGHANPQTPQHWNYPQSGVFSPPTAAGQVSSQGGSHDPWQSIRPRDLPSGSSQLHTVSQPETSEHLDDFNSMDLDDLYNQLFGASQHEVPSTSRSTPSTSSSVGDFLADDETPSPVQSELHEITSTPAKNPHNPPGSYSSDGSVPVPYYMLQNADPLKMWGKAVSFVYQEEEEEVSNTLVARLQLSRRLQRKRYAEKPRRLSSTAGFLEGTRTILFSDRLYSELFLDDRRFLVRLERNLIRVDAELKGDNLIIWELKSDGSRAFMVCRGVYPFHHRAWANVKAPATAQYFLRVLEGQPDKILVRRAEPEEALRPLGRHIRVSAQTAGDARSQDWDPAYQYEPDLNVVAAFDEPFGRHIEVSAQTAEDARRQDWDPTYQYEPDLNVMAAFDNWLDTHVDKPERRLEVPLVTDEAEVQFLGGMRKTFKEGAPVYPIELNGQTYLLAHYRGKIIGGPLYNSYATLWREEVQGSTITLVAVGLRPLFFNTFRNAVAHAKVEGRELSRHISDQPGPSGS
ncbi:uncharacterized protein UTRI_04313_B [Ustilago trichophora]|uniref:Uncharacterized protein n=1 Tax=Ustilago trichophora TaxID=86804 RepID=A0A5C3EDE3_9BASI|nr:uncharacterized protein UTRI_04313_B [Ustilago trichophora]